MVLDRIDHPDVKDASLGLPPRGLRPIFPGSFDYLVYLLWQIGCVAREMRDLAGAIGVVDLVVGPGTWVCARMRFE
jgi:hypothetical protein